MNTCIDCDARPAEYFDPRRPPLEALLCAYCLREATIERVSELEIDIKVLKETLRKATRRDYN